MNEKSLARRYAKALAASLSGDEQYRRVRADLENLVRVLAGDEQLRSGMMTFLFSHSQKREALAVAVRALGADDLTRRFLETLLAENRLGLLDHLVGQLDRVWQEHQGVEPVTVWSVRALEPRQSAELARNLERSFGRRVALEMRIDTDLIAGIRVMRGSTVYDFSLRGNLQKLRAAIAGD